MYALQMRLMRDKKAMEYVNSCNLDKPVRLIKLVKYYRQDRPTTVY